MTAFHSSPRMLGQKQDKFWLTVGLCALTAALIFLPFYLLDGGMLTLGPFYGLPACTKIPLGRGVCGTAARKDEVQRVADVHAFPGHIACDGASASELVIPLMQDGQVLGVLDLDSPVPARFTLQDQQALTGLCALLMEACTWKEGLL